MSGCNSVVESEPSKLSVAGSNPVTRSIPEKPGGLINFLQGRWGKLASRLKGILYEMAVNFLC